MSSLIAMRLTGGLLLAALLALVALVGESPGHFIYDEPFYVSYVPLLHKYGLTTEFVKLLPGSAGPLYAFVHFTLEPITNLQPARVRFVNVILLLVVASIVAAWLKRRNQPDYCIGGCLALVVPMTWVVAGMALTEMPAMMFVAISLYLQLRGLEALEMGRPVNIWFLTSGISLGIAVWGRQPYILLSGVPLLVALFDRRLRVPSLILVSVVVSFAIPLVIIWGGFVPPLTHELKRGLSVTHGLLSLGYTGVCFFLLAPIIIKQMSAKYVMGVVVLTAVANASLGGVVLYPVRSVFERSVPTSVLAAYGNLCGSLFLSCGIVFLVWILGVTWKSRKDLRLMTINMGLLCVAISPVFIAHQYSSRYAAMSLPYLLLAAQPWKQWNSWTFISAVVGCVIGFFSLDGYYMF